MSSMNNGRRRFLRELGVSAASLPFLSSLNSLAAGEAAVDSPKRLIVMFSPNGTLPDEFWPDSFGEDKGLVLKPMLSALEPFRDQTLILKGINNQVGGDGDNHMRGMSCLLTARQLNPGNIQGGGHTPAGWASGISIDQEVRNHFQANESTKTRFGSLEFGVAVPDRADPWTRMSYAGSDRPMAPIDDPEQMFQKMYGGKQDRKLVASVIDEVKLDLEKVSRRLSSADRQLLDRHLQSVRQLEQEIAASASDSQLQHPEPEIDPNIELTNDNTPAISRMQIDLIVNALANNMTRVATLQFMRSVGQARMRWLEIEEGHHSLSHEPRNNQQAHDKLRKINAWFAGELAYLAKRLSEIPEPGRDGETLLDNTVIVWLNELGEGNSHTLNNIPFLLVGGGAGFRTGRAIDFGGVPHNRLWMSVAHGLGHRALDAFGSTEFCGDGALDLL
ncbi:DUF1552 domain-containing protein [Rhodopirellula sp. MGV]|uniref:DUF1552 domain-containing protein n=1 Tax=Rhodopirellula sp. MGV TaxID=2023130 RepID=UPI000B973863|nr:DUF1552 domain-containing protein [Rhodopirellula sp. MGV]OYP36840.1 hypothetical protein CGZ80_07270 [Rhodopirellula sp. MGV]PNY36453.1 DUF1552 domain-containing protein [Rhodopirellula baltica]